MTTDRSEGEWHRAVRQQAAVAALGQLGLRSSDLEEVLREGMLAAADTLDIGDVALFEFLPALGLLRGRAALHQGQVVPRPSIDRLRIPAGSGSLPGYAVEVGIPVVTSDVVTDDRFVAVGPQFDLPVRAAIAAPIGWADTIWGVLGVWDRKERDWTEDDAHFVQAIASTMGLTIQRTAIEQDLRDSSLRLDLSLSAGGLGTWSWNIDHETVTLSPSALRMHGLGTGPFGGTADEFLALVHPDDRAALRGAVFEAAQTSGEQHHLFRIVRRDNGELRWIEAWGGMLSEEDESRNVVGVSSDITDRRRAEEVQDSVLAREHAARLEAESARERLAFLSESSARLSTSLDPDVTLATLTELAVPYLADVCLIDIIDEEGNLAEQAGRAVTDDALADIRELRRRRAARGGGGLWDEMQVALEAQTLLHTELTDEQFEAVADDDDHLALIRRLNVRSAVVVPLIARGRVLGVVSLMRLRGDRRYAVDDISLVEEFATRAALAVDNGKLFHSRNRVARSLQAALLPPALPVVEGLDLAARYQVAEADVAIGGDFYDVMELGAHSWGVVVGDVCGRGPDAAALTGLMRHSVRTVVVREELPSRVLAQTNAAVIDQIDDAKFCTAAYLRLSIDDRQGPGSVHVVASSAGHPRPAVLRASGEAELLDCAGTLLGVVDEPTLVDVETYLQPGDAVVLYTDGVTEARNDRELFGERRLLEALTGLAGQPAEAIAAGLERAVTTFRNTANDDTAILVAQAAPLGWHPRSPRG